MADATSFSLTVVVGSAMAFSPSLKALIFFSLVSQTFFLLIGIVICLLHIHTRSRTSNTIYFVCKLITSYFYLLFNKYKSYNNETAFQKLAKFTVLQTSYQSSFLFGYAILLFHQLASYV